MKAVKINLAGEERYLAFTGEAMFTIKDEFGGVSELLSAMSKDTREGYAVTCKAAAILAEQGELARRHMGHTPAPILDAAEISALTSPAEYAAVKNAIPVAIALGFGREIENEDEEVDLVLVELQKKRPDPRPLSPYGDRLRGIREGGSPHAARGDLRHFRAISPG